MAKLSKERYLVLTVDDSKDNALQIQLALSPQQRRSFIGTFADGNGFLPDLAEKAYSGQTKLSLHDMAQIDALMSQRGAEVIEWLQNQPFEDVVVVVLPTAEQDADCIRVMPKTVSVAPPANPPRNSTSLDLVKLLDQYFDRQH